MRATAILVRWKGGWRWVADDDADLRIELCEGQPGDDSTVIRKARGELRTYAEGETEHRIQIDPMIGDPVPGVDYWEGDEVFLEPVSTWFELEVLNFKVDDDTGRVEVVPQLGDVIDDPATRLLRGFRAIGGLASGTSKLARPVATNPPPDVRPDDGKAT